MADETMNRGNGNDIGRTTTTSPGGDFATSSGFATGDDNREGFANNPQMDVNNRISEADRLRESFGRTSSSFQDRFMSNFNGVSQMSRDYYGRFVRHAESNPWMHIGIAGAAGLLLGFAVGRSMSGGISTDFASSDIEDYDELDDADVE